MLDSFPTRAQPPIVCGRKWTFADARRSEASWRLIQSAAEGIGRQSPPDDEDEPSPDEDEPDDEDEDSDFEPDDEPEPEEPDDSPEPPEPPESPEPSDDFAFDELFPALDPPRSFFAQPEPLKWIVGGANSLRIVPSLPHDGQNWGPGSLRPWRMSVRWSQAVQAYS
jgi:hypothetical protein